MAKLTRRRLPAGSVLGGAALLHSTVPHRHPWNTEARAVDGHAGHGTKDGGHASFRDGRSVDHAANGFDPHEIARDFDWGKTRRLASGRVLREWELYAVNKEVIGLHNLGEGVAIGSAYSVGALALGAFLLVGFALHNTTEGLAIVAPLVHLRPSLSRLALLGLIAGGPAVLGAWIGAAAFNASLAAFLFGFGAGAIAQVIVQLAPSLRNPAGRTLHPGAVAGLLAGITLMFATGLLVTV